MAYEYVDGEYVDIGEDDTALSPRAIEALTKTLPEATELVAQAVEADDPRHLEDWYASPADQRLAEQYDRDEDWLREQQAGA